MHRYSRLLTTFTALGVAANVHAAEIEVPADFANIQAAINAAVDGDIVVVAPGGYAGQISFMGKAITVTSEDPLDPAATTLTAAAGSVVTFNNGEGPNSRLIGFTIDNVNAPTGGGAYVGLTANPVIENCVFEANLANNGGAMAVLGGAVVRNTVFVGNIANVSGGGVFAGPGSSLTLDACQFEGNDAPIGSALRIQGQATVTNTEVFDNVAGTAINVAGFAPVDLVNCTVVGNAVTGIELNGGAAFQCTIANSIVRANAAQIVGPAAFLDVRYSNVQGGFAGPGNINANAGFVNPPAGNFRLVGASPCIDAGENASVPPGIVFDVHGIVRFVDKSDVVDTGDGTAPIVDMGANEFPPPRRYVKADAPGANTGMTWTHAYTDLQDALDEAAGGADIEEIWVAKGTYHPDRGTGDRSMSFEMLSGVQVIGGFAGTELDVEARDAAANPTTLGGAIGAAGETDNSYHVVSAIGVDDTGKLIGFTVQKGYADGGVNDSLGGGIFLNGGNPVIRECWIKLNYAEDGGGGLYSLVSSPNISRNRFNQNTSGDLAGGIYLYGGMPQVINCVLSGNEAEGAAAIYVQEDSAADITNCTIVGNTANTGLCGGIVTLGDVDATNNILRYNTGVAPLIESQQFLVVGLGTATVNYCNIQGWTGALGGTFNFGDNPLFVDASGADNVYGTADDDVHLSANSHCIDSGDRAALPSFVDFDVEGNDRFIDDVGMPNLGDGAVTYLDRGAYEGTGTSCLGDITANGEVNIDDLFDVIGEWGVCPTCFTDLNASGTIDIDDLFTVIGGWGPCAP